MAKKALACVLCAVMVISQLCCALVAPASASGRVLTQDFESYDTSGTATAKYTYYTASGEGDTNVHSGTHSLYRPAGADTYLALAFPEESQKALTAGSTYELKAWVKVVSVPTSVGTLQYKYSSVRDNAYTTVEGSVASNIFVFRTTYDRVGEWAEVSCVFTATHDGYLTLAGWGTAEMYLDDITLTLQETADTAIHFETNGGNTLTPLAGRAGEDIGTLPLPEKAGFVFGGWYTDSALTQKFTATVFPAADITLYAKWNPEGSVLEDYEDYTVPSGGTYFISGSALDTSVSHSPSTSLHVSNVVNTRAFLFSGNAAKVEKGKSYQLTLWANVVTAGTLRAYYTVVSDNCQAITQTDGTQLFENLITSSQMTALKNAGGWQEYSYTFTAKANGWLSLYHWGGVELYIDDACLTELTSVTITFETNGGSTPEPLNGAAGSPIGSLPVPEKDGASFAGWYTDSELANPFADTVFPDTDITLYAKWGKPGVTQQDFETYVISGSVATKNFSVYTKSGADDPAVHGGNRSLFRQGQPNTSDFAVIFPNALSGIQTGKGYQLDVWVYVPEAVTDPGGLQLTFLEDKNNAYSVGDRKKVSLQYFSESYQPGVWKKLTYTFTSGHNGYLGFYVFGGVSLYIDDITLTEVGLSTVRFETNGGSSVEPITGAIGSAVGTLPVPTKENQVFNGWYTDPQLTAGFTGTVFPESDVTLYAAWTDPGVFTQPFESYVVSGSVASAGLSVYHAAASDDPLVHGGSSSLHRPGGVASYFASLFPNSLEGLKKDQGYCLKMWVYLPSVIEKENEGAVQLTFLSDRSNCFSGGDIKRQNIQYFNYQYSVGEWRELTYYFTAPADCWPGIYTYGGMELYIDDITLTEVDTVTITMDSKGGNAIDPMTGAAGQLISSTPIPTHPEGKSFAGWFLDEAYTEKFSFQSFPQTDVTVYAKWIAKGSFEQTFEGYYYENGGSSTSYDRRAYSVYHASSDADTNVHSGKTSMHYVNNPLYNQAYSFSIMDPDMGTLTVGEKYYVSVWMKFERITATFYYALYNHSVVDNPGANYVQKMYSTVHKDIIGQTGNLDSYCFGVGDKFKVSEPDENGWIQFTYETTATDKYFAMFLAWDADVYLDDITITPLPSGAVDTDYSKPYCEPLYDEIAAQYPAVATKRSGTPQVYPLALTARGDYVFSAAVNPGSDGAYVALAWDPLGQNIIDGTKITEGNSGAVRTVLDHTGVVYLVVYNPVGEGAFDRLLLFRTISALDAVHTNSGSYPNYTDANLPTLGQLLKQDKYADVLLDASFTLWNQEDPNAPYEASPQTGDNRTTLPALAGLIIALGALLVTAAGRRKRMAGGKSYES